jgi:hypothetical protein
MRLSEIPSLLLSSLAVRKFNLYLRCKRNCEKDWENKRGKGTGKQTRAESERERERVGEGGREVGARSSLNHPV